MHRNITGGHVYRCYWACGICYSVNKKKMAYFNLNYDFAPQLESPAEAEEIDRNNLKKFSFLTVNLLVLKFVMKCLPPRQQRKQHRNFIILLK